jgi:hypothetical protein
MKRWPKIIDFAYKFMWRNISERKNKLADMVKSQIRIRVNQDGTEWIGNKKIRTGTVHFFLF